MTIALSRPVASAAVEALGLIGTPEATRGLRALLAEVHRRDLLRRIAAIVGEPTPETHARDERIRREKRRAVQRRADPEPQERQRLATAAVRVISRRSSARAGSRTPPGGRSGVSSTTGWR